jgi:hypothetical protein
MTPTDLATTRMRLLVLLGAAVLLAGVMLVTVRLIRDSTPAAPALDQVDWSARRYPMDCGGLPQEVTRVVLGDATGDRRAEAVVAARCAAGAGSPPSAVFVFGVQAGQPEPQLLATLIKLDQNVLIDDVGASVEGITARGHGYSSPDVPRCCPDLEIDWRWQWTGSGFARISS